MKSILFFAIAVLIGASASALEFSEIAGKYKATSAYPVYNIIDLSATGQVGLQEISMIDPNSVITCQGQASISGMLVNSDMTCDNGRGFHQVIDLTNVNTKAKTFEANVFSTAYGRTVLMTFERL